jgi:Tol biopolymer transport system component
LEKLPADRFGTAAEFAHALSHPEALPASAMTAPATGIPSGGGDRRFMGAVAVAALLGLAALVGWFRSPAAAEGGIIQFDLVIPEATKISPSVRSHLTISPSGDRIVFAGLTPQGDGELLYVRELREMTVTPLAGTEGAIAPTFSPDGMWIAYFDGPELKKVPASGGASITLTSSAGRGAQAGAWLDDGTIVFTDSTFGLSMVSEAGGAPQVVFSSEGNGGMYWPQAVPGERAVVASMCRTDDCDEDVLVAIDVDTREVQELFDGVPNGWVLPSGHLVFARIEGALFAVPFDKSSLTVNGSPIPLLEGVRVQNGVVANLAFSRTGTLVYLTGDATVESQIVLVDRDGTERALTRQLRDYVDPRFSPDGRQLVVEIHDPQGNGHLWIYDVASETLSRLTYEGHDGRSLWSPDGKTVLFSSNMNGGWKAYTVPADGSATPELAIDSVDYFVRSKTLTPDSKTLVFHSEGGEYAPYFTLYSVDLGSGEAPRRIVETSALEWTPSLSRDGQWLAYASNESGREEIYVRNFQNPAGRYPVSVEGGSEPLWGEGNELFFRGPDGMYSATLEFRPAFRVVRRERLFDDQPYAVRVRSRAYDLHPISGEFLFVRVEESSSHPRVVVNFVQELKEKVGRQ